MKPTCSTAMLCLCRCPLPFCSPLGFHCRLVRVLSQKTLIS